MTNRSRMLAGILAGFMFAMLIVGALLYELCQPRVPVGAIPSQPPSEANRLHHPAGFSIVRPPHWELGSWGRHNEYVQLQYYLPPTSGIRVGAMITIAGGGRDRPSGLDAYQKTLFQGQEAYEAIQVNRRWTTCPDDPASSRYTLFFKHQDRWFSIDYLVQDELTVLPGIVRQYLNTLRWDQDQ
ncbi:MAG TPA: hypothetical protein VF590_14670 [Isosphaeraceae bacterium]